MAKAKGSTKLPTLKVEMTATHKKSKGRPSKYSAAIAEVLCERLAAGETLTAICKSDGLPSEKTVRTWAMDPEHPFSPQYARAREVGYMKMADDLLDIADDASDDYQRSRLRVDARKWLLSKALPKIFGDKLQSEVSGKDGGPIAVTQVDDITLAREIAYELSRAIEQQDVMKQDDARDRSNPNTPLYRR